MLKNINQDKVFKSIIIRPLRTENKHFGPVHTTPFLYKNGDKNLRFCESVHTDPHKNATKTVVIENAVKSGYSQKRRFLKTHLINVNAQKRGF